MKRKLNYLLILQWFGAIMMLNHLLLFVKYAYYGGDIQAADQLNLLAVWFLVEVLLIEHRRLRKMYRKLQRRHKREKAATKRDFEFKEIYIDVIPYESAKRD